MSRKLLFLGIILFLSTYTAKSQNFGDFASALIVDTNVVNPNDGPQGIQDWFCLTTCDPNNTNTIFPNSANLDGASLGTRLQFSNSLQLDGGEFKTFKNSMANVCGINIYYRIYVQGTTPPAFSIAQITTVKADCNAGEFNDGFGPCSDGDQKWQVGENFAGSAPQFNIDITRSCAGLNVFEVYYIIRGSNTSTNGCSDTVTINNNGLNYKATLTLTSNLSATISGPTTSICVGQNILLGVSNIIKTNPNNVTFLWTGPNGFTSNQQNPNFLATTNSGGTYTCVVTDSCGLQYSDSVNVTIDTPIVPNFSFSNNLVICAGATVPDLPTVSSNGINGIWNVENINAFASSAYTFMPAPNECAESFILNVNVNALPPVPQGSVTLQPTCESPTGTITLTSPIALATYPNLFISEVTDEEVGSLTYIELFNGTGSSVNLSNYKIRVFNNGNTNASCSLDLSGTIANNATFIISIGSTANVGGVVPNISFPTCAGINTNDNIRLTNLSNTTIDNWGRTDGMDFTPLNQPGYTYRRINNSNPPFTGWNTEHWTVFDPQVYDNIGQYMGATSNQYTYSIDGINYQNELVFTNVSGGNYNVTVQDNVTGCISNPLLLIVNEAPTPIVPTFDFGNSLTICSGESVPSLPTTSLNNIEGIWNFSTVSNTESETYVFTPDSNFCATTFTFEVTVNPIANPTFDFGNSLTICSGESVPNLPTTSLNNIEGTWNFSTVSNTESETYVFTPNPTFCATTFTFEVSVNQFQNPTFDFGNSLTICAGDSVPSLPTTSSNGIQGTWNALSVNNTQNGTYIFTSINSACTNATFTFEVTVNQIQNSTFDFGNSLTICAGDSVPSLPTTSSNGIQGTWNFQTVSNTQSETYIFTPTNTNCSTIFNFIVSVSPSFDFEISGGCVSNNYELQVNGEPENAIYSWQDSNGNSIGNNTTILNVTSLLNSTPQNEVLPLTYQVSITSIDGCVKTKAFTIESIFCGIQKGISPNGDGSNDFFDLSLLNVAQLSIYNRYGTKVYEKLNYKNEWFGQSNNGNELPSATYYYVISFNSGESKTGWIYVMSDNVN